MTKRLIINADDLGYDPAITRGIVESLGAGIVSSTTLMVNTPFSDAAASAVKGYAVGIHFNLARFRPLSSGFPSMLLRGGEFDEAKVSQIPSAAVEDELFAQLRIFEKLLSSRASHVDVHKHLHRHANVLSAILEVAAKTGLAVRSVDQSMREQMRFRRIKTNDEFLGEDSLEAYWTRQRFTEAVQSIDEGVTELMCHPGYSPEKTITGYGEQREVELETMLAPSSRRVVQEAGIQVTTYHAL